MPAAKRRPLATNKRAQTLFITAVAAGKTQDAAAAGTGYSRRSFLDLRKDSEAFAALFADAYEAGADVLEEEAIRRAVTGVTEPLVNHGRVVRDDDGNVLTVTRFSDQLLMFMLKARRPERFRESHRVEHTGADGGPIEVMQLVEGARDRLVGKLASVVALDSRRTDEAAGEGTA
jgi:hypothetical protein